MEKCIIVIAGPTAVGKTGLSLKLARELHTGIISFDSRQCYREMSVGTAKPTSGELKKVPHYFINSHSVEETISAGDYARLSRRYMEQAFQHHDTVILTGGTGLYLKAALEGMSDIPGADPGIRADLNRIYHEEGIEPLQEKLAMLDPAYYAHVDRQNPQRMIRALEVCISTNLPYSYFQKRGNVLSPLPYRTLMLGLEMDRSRLYEGINDRVDQMVQDGLFEEVKSLMDYREHYALKTVGYREVFRYFDGDLNKDQTIELIKRNTRRYAKRQITWFKKDPEMNWFTPDQKEQIRQFVFQSL